MKNRIITIGIAALLLGAALAQTSFALGRNYVDRRRVIRAGVLVCEKYGVGWTQVAPAAPYIFYIMDQRQDLKPSGWSFVNPLAGGKDSFKNYAAYWQVPLRQTTLENLAKFDVLYMSAQSQVDFQMADRDKLRRFIDGGGCLWVDNGGNMSFRNDALDHSFDFCLPGVNFKVPGGGIPFVMSSLHPLLTNPFWLGPSEINVLDTVSAVINPGFAGGLVSIGDLPNPTTLSPVVAVQNGPTVAAIEYGSGRVVVTSGFIGGRIQYPVAGGNPGLYMDQNANMLAASPANLRFAYNVVSWASAYTTYRKGYRHNGFSLENIGAPLVNKWQLDAGGAGDETSPVVWKNVIFYAAGGTLYALGAVPEEDLDMDGNPDDGEQNAPGVDIIWRANIGGQISTPTVAGMIDPKGGTLVPRDFVLVTANVPPFVYIFEALPSVNGRLSDAAVPRPDLWDFPTGQEPTATAEVLSPPVVQNGWIYASAGQGRVYGHSPVYAQANSQSIPGAPAASWYAALSPSTPSDAKIKSALSLGFAKNRATGAVVQQLSFIGHPQTVDGMPLNDCIFSMPVFVSSDRLTPLNQNDLTNPPGGLGSPIVFKTSYPNLSLAEYPEPQIWAVDTEGNSVSLNPLQPSDYTTQQGQVSVSGAGLGPNVRVYMSYGLDYSKLTGATPFDSNQSYQLEPRPMANAMPSLEVKASPAIGPNDAYYMPVTWPGNASGNTAVYCVGFEGTQRGARLKWNYFLHGGGTFSNPSGDPMKSSQQFALDVLDPAHKWGIYAYGYQSTGTDGSGKPIYPFGQVTDLSVVSTPAVTNDRVFVTATASTAGLSGGYLLCFKADPTFQIRTNRPFKDVSTGENRTVTIYQPDMLFNQTGSGDISMLSRQIGGDMVDYDSGTITITDFAKVRLKTYMPATGSSLILDGSTISPSLPVWVFLDGTPIPIQEIDFSSWDNLLWALAIPDHAAGQECKGISSSPVVLGDYVYFTCDDGYLFAVDVDAVPMNQTYRVLLDPNSLDYAQKLDELVPMRQPINPANTVPGARASVAGAGGSLAVPTAGGLYDFNNPMTLITDNHRVMEVGGDGKVAWACDSVFEPKAIPTAMTTTLGQTVVALDSQSLNKPMVAQKFGGSDYLVVDSGNDRVMRMDRGGQVMWLLKGFSDPGNLLRSGEPKTLRAPSDARMWSEMEKVTDTDGDKWYYVLHCLVVDTGNFRIVDIVNRFNSDENGQVSGPELAPNGQPIGHQLRWVSNTSYRDKKFSFNSVQLVRGVDTNGNEIGEVWASVLNYGLGTSSVLDQTSATGGGHLGGAIMALDYRKSTGAFQWEYHDGEVKAQLTTLDDAGTKVALSGPRYFSVLDSTVPKLLICDSTAVYVTEGSTGNIKWQLTADDYAKKLKRQIKNSPNAQDTVNIPFSPYRAQMLPNNRVLVTNSYAGRTNDPKLLKFTGEVFEVDWAKTNIYWYAPEMVVDGPDIVQQMKNAPNLDQPTCSQRLN